MSRLESLPTELLQDIAILSGNIDLPLVSVTIAQRLSTDFIKSEMLRSYMNAPNLKTLVENSHRLLDSRMINQQLASPADLQFVYRRLVSAFFRKPVDKARKLNEPLAAIQSRILNCGWMTYALLTECTEDTGFDLYLTFSRCPVVFPSRLLRGPWTDDKIKFVDRVLRSYCQIGHELCDCPTCDQLPAYIMGMKGVIAKPKPEVITVLLKPYRRLYNTKPDWVELFEFAMSRDNWGRAVVETLTDKVSNYARDIYNACRYEKSILLGGEPQCYEDLRRIYIGAFNHLLEDGRREDVDWLQQNLSRNIRLSPPIVINIH